MPVPHLALQMPNDILTLSLLALRMAENLSETSKVA